MKVLYIETLKKQKDEKININLKELPKELVIAYSIQYKPIAEQIRKELIGKIRISDFMQVLGCSKIDDKYKNMPILLVGSGKFHALNLALQNNSAIYLYNGGAINKVDNRDVEELKKRKTSLYNRFLNAKNIGIIVSTKPGQERMKEAGKLSKLIEKKYPQKKVYLLVSGNININEFENFDIDFFINTACPGLLNDSAKIGNIDDILSFLR